LLGAGFKDFLNFHPENWGEISKIDGSHIFQVGEKNTN